MKIEIEFKTGTVDASQITKKISPILDSVKQQGLDSREFSIEMDIGSNSGGKSQFAQKKCQARIQEYYNFLKYLFVV